MAVCEIWDVRGRLDHPIDYAENPEKTANPKYSEAELQAMVDVMEYATNKNKTEQRFFVTGVNCEPTTARDEMMITKAGWSDTSEIVCYHGFQSFKHGEVTPEQAHEVGVKLAERMWGDRFQVIVATHLNTDCLHNHFVVNSVSFADGMHYHDNKANLRLLRQRSDELCREYALSVIEHPSGKKKPYALYQAEKQGRPTRDNVARQAVDEAISKSFTLKDFDRQLAEMGYRINFDPNRKYWTIIGKGWQRPKRLYKLGEEYTNDRIMERISENSYAVKFQSFSEPQPQVKVYRVKGSLKNAKKIGGLRGLYLHYCYKLGILPKGRKQNYARLHYLLKDDLMKMEAITQETSGYVTAIADSARILCEQSGKTLSIQNNISDIPIGIDYTFVSQVNNNLISNAIRYATSKVNITYTSLITYLIKEIQIYPNGESEQPLKSIEFNFPIYRDGQEVRRLLWEKGNTVETVVLLSQQKPDDTIEIDLDLDELDATVTETKATYEKIKAYIWDRHHLKVSSLYISQIKRKCGLEVGQNYNLSKSENPKVPKCPPEKEAAIMDALKHFQMI